MELALLGVNKKSKFESVARSEQIGVKFGKRYHH